MENEFVWHSPTLGNWAKAFAAYQGEFLGVEKNAKMTIGGGKDDNGGFKKGTIKAYSDLSEILNTVRPLLSKNGLAFTQLIGGGCVTSYLIHESGEFMASRTNVESFLEKKGHLAYVQSFGIVLTYLKRYSAASMLGVSSEEDSDGDDLKAGIDVDADDSPIDIAIKAAFSNPIKNADDKPKAWLAIDKPYVEPKLPAFTACTSQEGVLRWVNAVAPLRLGASKANKDAIKAKYESLKPQTT